MKNSESLKKTSDFQKVYKKKKSKAKKYLIMYIYKNNMNINRIGISCSKKVGNSVVRHRMTRLIREAYRLHEEYFNIGLDMVVVVRPSAKDVGYQEMSSALMHLANLHHITRRKLQKKVL